MAKEIVWGSLTPEEAKTLADLERRGVKVFAAPIEIEHREQLETLGITKEQCRTWYIGSEKVVVHLTPSDESCYKFLLNDLRSKHRNGYRSERCKIPGTLKPLITCPESNRCSKCPYTEYRDQHKSNMISWDELAETGYEGADVGSRPIEKVDAKIEYGEIRGLLDEVNPIISEILEMKICDECSVQEIADTLGISKRNVYFYLDRARAIGKKYNNN